MESQPQNPEFRSNPELAHALQTVQVQQCRIFFPSNLKGYKMHCHLKPGPRLSYVVILSSVELSMKKGFITSGSYLITLVHKYEEEIKS